MEKDYCIVQTEKMSDDTDLKAITWYIRSYSICDLKYALRRINGEKFDF